MEVERAVKARGTEGGGLSGSKIERRNVKNPHGKNADSEVTKRREPGEAEKGKTGRGKCQKFCVGGRAGRTGGRECVLDTKRGERGRTAKGETKEKR